MRPPNRARRSEELFAEALAHPQGDRAAFLDRSCAGDPGLRRELAELLQYADEDSDFLASPVLRSAVPDVAEMFGLGDDGEEPMPAQVGGYPIVRVLGRGASGVVYEARQLRPPRTVAIKLLYPGPVGRSTLSRFTAEARLLARLDHPAIARLHEAGSERVPGSGGTGFRLLFLVMEHVEGERLDRWADRPERSTGEILTTFSTICDAVGHAHWRGVIHRDLKPANILVTPSGAPKVLDFGIARAIADTSDTADTGDGQHATRATLTGQGLGSLAYACPEQLRDGRHATARSDVYSLGVILYQLLSGRLPFDLGGLPPLEAAAVVGKGTPPTLAPRRPVPAALEAAIARAMAREPRDRYGSAADLATAVAVSRCAPLVGE